ncbi:MAG: amidohydrolase family protein, partial [Candidatus Puniceispirillum sp.]
MIDLDAIRAIDIHTHAEEPCGMHADDGYDDLQSAMAKYFKAPWTHPPTIPETAAYFRAQKIAAVIFPVDSERETGYRRYKNEEVAELAAEHNDILIPFASIDPWKGKMGVREARRLIRDYGIKGFKFHPTLQGFYPNDRIAYPLYEAIAEEGLIGLFHTGQTGVGSGMTGGNGMRLKYSNPLYLDDVAVDFPDMKIIMAHPSFPWQEEALAV